ncbi:hypothetical protein H5200_19000 [Pseudoalteromonas sp. SG43-7]|jgi:hypothetical protein|uniref:DUF2975 domain-containing protein n=1 Tax=Pseudoalteromonas neustonica TaxID=1840331 RepID=A0ABY3F817_9GAMM|nr:MULTISPECIES: hypothetical protein [Pseudoalteromonas]MBB1292747.1 hypothetical protein [Pseudoalteromonas sp. SR41-4]MBB1423984.1 hypothetical protein [Pseudoalteromonas sp. SG43-7]MBE0376965.1 hypothetical protein [Pseudoalteromonas prydzensis ACAM 620]TVU80015.1 hypothetical protein FQP85_21350 [Pseudoalteromonas neustonica]|tara:strand:- start:490 stop:990 length:501 start_codon:yes stop_codon:yes gene_type:complete
MTRSEQLKELLQSISFRELTLSIDLLVSVYISFFYVDSLINATTEQLASVSWLSGLLLQVLTYSVVLMVLSYLLLAFISDNELKQPLDVREKQINLIGYKYKAVILQVGICIAIFQYQIEANGWGPAIEYNIPYLPMHVMVGAFLIAEITNYIAQLYKGRTGDIYE